MKKLLKRTVAIGLAATLAVAAVAGTAYAYFTDQVKATGVKEVVFGYDYKTNDNIVDGKKVVNIENTGQTEIAARVMIFGAEDAKHAEIVPDKGWSKEIIEGVACFTYTKKALAPGEKTTNIVVELTGVPEDESDQFEVIVVGQASPVAYNEDGTKWWPYNWTATDEQE